MTIQQMIESIRNGSLSSRSLVSQYISNMEAMKYLNAVIEINPDAFDIADALDARTDKRGALFGVPILVKDNINTGDRMHTSAGSVALSENLVQEDAPVVQLLREARAVILGKTNMTEFANFMTDSAMPNGYSSRGGQVLNLFDHETDPSGSSTGSAVAVAANLCAAAVGTETCGSIISPAQCAGIVGIKPTIGLVSNSGVIPISFTLDTPGPMARCVDDVSLLMGVLSGQEYSVRYGAGLRGVRIGICRMLTEDTDPEWLAANDGLISVMNELNGECAELPEHDIKIGKHMHHVTKHEFKFGINSYLKALTNPALPKNLQEIIEYNERHPDVALKYGQDNLIDVEETTSGEMTETLYADALIARDAAIHDFNRLFDDNRIDVLFILAANSGLGAWTGFPSMTIPLGVTSKGLPIGSYFVARRYGEELLIRVAGEIEHALQGRH